MADENQNREVAVTYVVKNPYRDPLWPPNRAPVHRERQAWDQGFAAAIAATTTELRAMSDEWLTVEAADYIERLVPLWRDER